MTMVNSQLNFLEQEDSDDGEATTSELQSGKTSTSTPKRALDDIDCWSFDTFLLANTTENRPLTVLGKTLFNRYGFMEVLGIPSLKAEAFLNRIEDGYGNNEYHNSLHASSVVQSMHYFLNISGFKSFLSNLEIFASLFAAIIHDYNHNGKTNRFLVMTGADRALLYNDRSVQENHHLSASFFILKEPEYNMLENLSNDQYRQFRAMVIDMVLSTDMVFHFQLIQEMKDRLEDQSPITEKNKVMSFILHTSDIAASGHRWNLHIKWLKRLLKEFFSQGDLEKKLGLPVSAMCDRETTLIPESQIHWIDFIVDPMITTSSNLIERILNERANDPNKVISIDKPWIECMQENKRMWKTKVKKGK